MAGLTLRPGQWLRPRSLAGGLLTVTLLLYFVIPVAAVVLYGLATRWTTHALPDGYTLAHWQAALADGRFLGVLGRSVGLATATALLDLAVVLPAVYWKHVRNPRLGAVIEPLAAIPFSLPYAVIAFGLLGLTGDYAPGLQGTLWLLLPAHGAVAFSFVYWALDGAMTAARVSTLSEAAKTCGAGPWRALIRVVLPNIGPGLASGAILAFGVSFNDIALVQILAGARFETVQLYMLNMLRSTDADFNLLAVMASVTFVVAVLLSLATIRLGTADQGAKIR